MHKVCMCSLHLIMAGLHILILQFTVLFFGILNLFLCKWDA